MRIDDVSLWESFQSVAKHGNFSKAATALHLSVPQVSKRVARLEAELGARLFQRSTRVVTLTEEGRTLVPRVTSILEDLRGIETSFEDKQQLQGTIRLTSTPFFAHYVLLPLLVEFQAKHPLVRVELDLSMRIVNLVEENIDLALRIHHRVPDDSELVYRKLAPHELVLCAAPSYLKRAKAPLKSVDDLARHPLLMMNVLRGTTLKGSRRTLGDFDSSRSVQCENSEFLIEMALKGHGVFAGSRRALKDHLRAGRLVEVLTKHALESGGSVYAVVPSRRMLARRVRVFLDLLVDRAKNGF